MRLEPLKKDLYGRLSLNVRLSPSLRLGLTDIPYWLPLKSVRLVCMAGVANHFGGFFAAGGAVT